jgi:hypothetical protein
LQATCRLFAPAAAVALAAAAIKGCFCHQLQLLLLLPQATLVGCF